MVSLIGGKGGVETGGQLYIKEKLKHTNNVVDVLSKKILNFGFHSFGPKVKKL